MRKVVVGVVVVAALVLVFMLWPRSAPNGSGGGTPPATSVAQATPSGPMATVRVTAKYDGPVGAPKRLPTEADAFCAKHPLVDESLVAHDDVLENVFVRVTNAPKSAPPSTPAVLEQDHCAYTPRVQGVVLGQDLLIKSLDDTTHNVHAYRGEQSLFNRAESKGEFTKTADTLGDAPGLLTFKCDIHPWMTGYVQLVDNPYFAVTGSSGTATLHVPPGHWKLEAWQESLGTLTAEIDATPNTPTDISLQFHAKQ